MNKNAALDNNFQFKKTTGIMPEKIVIIGAQAAGLAAARAARRANAKAEITLIDSASHAGVAACGLPHYISGKYQLKDIASLDPASLFEKSRIKIFTRTKVIDAHVSKRRLTVKKVPLNDLSGETMDLSWDSLIITAGSVPFIPGHYAQAAQCPNFFVLKNLDHAHKLRHQADLAKNADPAKEIVILGAGYIGLSLAEIFKNRGSKVTVIESSSTIAGLDIKSAAAQVLAEKIIDSGVNLILNEKNSRPIIRRISDSELLGAHFSEQLITGVETSSGLIPCSTFICAAGVVPAPEPAQIFGLETGIKGAIKTDQYCQTSVDSIYAAGDCTESKSIYTRRPVLFQLAVNAVPCGKIAGYNAAVSVIAPKKAYPGTMLTTNSYFFGLEIASAGLSTMHDLVNHMKDRAGRLPESTVFDPSKYALHSETLPLKPFLDSRPDNHTITVSIVFHKKTGRIAGASFIAPHSACLRADLLAALMSGKTPLENTSYHTSSPVSGLTLEDLADIETGYTPSVRPFNDPLSITARAAALALENSGVARDTALNHPDTDSFLSLSRLN